MQTDKWQQLIMKKGNIGKKLNAEWNVNAKHALYNEVGKGYEKLREFPGALFDREGFVLFDSEKEYREYIENGYLNEGAKLSVPRGGIKNIPGYRRPLGAIAKKFEEAVLNSQRDSREVRQARLAQAQKNPERVEVTTHAYIRNPDVVAEVLDRAGGICEQCKGKAPFKRRTNGTPYLEVHHRVALADSGEDTIENSIALCPNCHREFHFG